MATKEQVKTVYGTVINRLINNLGYLKNKVDNTYNKTEIDNKFSDIETLLQGV